MVETIHQYTFHINCNKLFWHECIYTLLSCNNLQLYSNPRVLFILKIISLYMSQLRAGGPVIPGLLRPARVEYGQNTRQVVTATRFTTVMKTISIYGRARTSLTKRWQVLFSRYS